MSPQPLFPAPAGAAPCSHVNAEALRAATAALAGGATDVSTTLPLDADAACALFADVGAIPTWLPLVASARVLRRDGWGRPEQVAFLARFERATLGYTLRYQHDPVTRTVSWSTPPESELVIAGAARFTPLGAGACLLHYHLALEVPVVARFLDTSYSDHAATAVAAAFRDFVRRR
jgi:polyketide cyclase/dehydrase/lipid transport protein